MKIVVGFHRWWHDGRGYRHAFCLFCGADYLTVEKSACANEPCPSPLAAGGETKAQEILAKVGRSAATSAIDFETPTETIVETPAGVCPECTKDLDADGWCFECRDYPVARDCG